MPGCHATVSGAEHWPCAPHNLNVLDRHFFTSLCLRTDRTKCFCVVAPTQSVHRSGSGCCTTIFDVAIRILMAISIELNRSCRVVLCIAHRRLKHSPSSFHIQDSLTPSTCRTTRFRSLQMIRVAVDPFLFSVYVLSCLASHAGGTSFVLFFIYLTCPTGLLTIFKIPANHIQVVHSTLLTAVHLFIDSSYTKPDTKADEGDN